MAHVWKASFELDCKTCGKRSMFPLGKPWRSACVQFSIMRDHVRILAWCFIVYSAIIVLIGVGIGSIVLFGGAISGNREAILITSAVGAGIACFLIVLSLPGMLAGIGLLKMRPWARIIAIVVGVLHILSFPLGTALGIYTLWVLLNVETEALFRGQQLAVA
jgi:hypothetical protein